MAYLKTAEIEKIEDASYELILRAYGDDRDENISLPIDINKLVDTAGLSLKRGTFPADISGAFDRSSKTIYVASDEPYGRVAFTIAHELGHYILHADKASEVFYRKDLAFFSNPEVEKQETEANWFAASLLMPRNFVERYAPLIDDLDQLATLFGVSRPAMFYRLKSLGYDRFDL